MADSRVLTLVAASGLAREVLAVPGLLERYDEVRLLDDDPERWGTTVAGVRVEGPPDRVSPADDVLLCAGRGTTRRVLRDRVCAAGARRFATIRHPSVDVPPGCHVGVGSILLAHAALTADVTVGEHVVVMPQVSLTHDDVVADFATLCAGVSLGGGVTIGEGAYIGMNAGIREDLTVGAGALIGMGAVVVSPVPAGEVWVGLPARRLPATAPVEP